MWLTISSELRWLEEKGEEWDLIYLGRNRLEKDQDSEWGEGGGGA